MPYQEYDKIYSRKYRKKHPEWKKMDNERNKEKMKECTKIWVELNPEKKRAMTILNQAIKCKRIDRIPCDFCGQKKAQGHHQNYNKPLDVWWLCPQHHKDIHRFLERIGLRERSALALKTKIYKYDEHKRTKSKITSS